MEENPLLALELAFSFGKQGGLKMAAIKGRKDSKGYVLRTGETQRGDCRNSLFGCEGVLFLFIKGVACYDAAGNEK